MEILSYRAGYFFTLELVNSPQAPSVLIVASIKQLKSRQAIEEAKDLSQPHFPRTN